MPRLNRFALPAIAASLVISPAAFGQVCLPYQTYRLQMDTVSEPQQVTVYRTEYVDEFIEREIVSYMPVTTKSVQKRSYTVRRPVVETSSVSEVYTVYKPVEKTETVDKSYYETTYVDETSEREEKYMTYKPVVETVYQTQRVIVQRPVVETQMQLQNVTVQRPVMETQYQTQNVTVQRPVVETQYQTQTYTAMRPVTTYQPAIVDQGGYVAQQYVQPGDTRFHLKWQSSGYVPNPASGQVAYRRGGLGWVPYTSPPLTSTQVQYQANYQQVAVPQTSYMPQTYQQQVAVPVTRMQSEVVQQQVPVQVMRMQDQVIQQQVAVPVTRMQDEYVDQQVPVQVQKMQAVEESRKVPFTVRRPVQRLVPKSVQETRVEYVPEQHVRQIPVEKTSYKYETVDEDIPIESTSYERVVRKERVPVRVPRTVATTETRMVQKRVLSRVPLNYFDPYSTSIMNNQSTFRPLVEGSPIVQPPSRTQESRKVPVPDAATNGASTKGAAADPSSPAEKSGEKSSAGATKSFEVGDPAGAKDGSKEPNSGETNTGSGSLPSPQTDGGDPKAERRQTPQA